MVDLRDYVASRDTLAFMLTRPERPPSGLKPAPNPMIDSSYRSRPAPERSLAGGELMPSTAPAAWTRPPQELRQLVLAP